MRPSSEHSPGARGRRERKGREGKKEGRKAAAPRWSRAMPSLAEKRPGGTGQTASWQSPTWVFLTFSMNTATSENVFAGAGGMCLKPQLRLLSRRMQVVRNFWGTADTREATLCSPCSSFARHPRGIPKMWLFHPSVPPVGLLGAAGSCAEALGRTGQVVAAPCSALAASPETKPHQKDKNGPKAVPDVCHGPCRTCPGVAKPWLQRLPRRVSQWLLAGRAMLAPATAPGAQHQRHRGQGCVPMLPLPFAPPPTSQVLAVLFVPRPRMPAAPARGGGAWTHGPASPRHRAAARPPRLSGTDLCSRTRDVFSIYFCTLYNVDV